MAVSLRTPTAVCQGGKKLTIYRLVGWVGMPGMGEGVILDIISRSKGYHSLNLLMNNLIHKKYSSLLDEIVRQFFSKYIL